MAEEHVVICAAVFGAELLFSAFILGSHYCLRDGEAVSTTVTILPPLLFQLMVIEHPAAWEERKERIRDVHDFF